VANFFEPRIFAEALTRSCALESRYTRVMRELGADEMEQVMFRKLSLKSQIGVGLFVLTLGSSIISACGGSSLPIPTQSQPPQAINVALTNSSPAIDTGQADSLTATVRNDPNNKGVKWTIACPSGVTACGGMAQATSASGAVDRYNAPSSVSAAETLTVTATSASDPSKFISVQVTVNPTPSLVSPAPPPPPPGTVGQFFSLDLTQYAQGGTAPDTWSIKSGTLPAGLTLNTNTGIVSGIPTNVTSAMHGRVQVSTAGTAATIVIVFTRADSGNPSVPVNVSVSLTINAAPALTISPSSGALPNGTVGAPYGSTYCSFVFSGECRRTVTGVRIVPGGGAQPYAWSWSAAAGSSLPPGLTLPPGSVNVCLFFFHRFFCHLDGLISGTPTTAGTYNVVVNLSDAESPPMQTSAPYTITIVTPSPSPSPT
jgi:hypothetical protein